MPERVVVQLEAPTEHDPGQITEGFYSVADGVLAMVYANGSPVLIDGKPIEARLGPNDNPRAIAGRLTREVRRALANVTETEERFNRTLRYGNTGFA